MPKVAKAEPNARLGFTHAGVTHTFEFGDDGTRQVSEAEAAALESYRRNGGPLKVEVTDSKKGAK